MKTKPRLLDLFCGAGGASVGYHRAGFDVFGVDINPQPNYPFKFHRMDALSLLDIFCTRGKNYFVGKLSDFDAIHASPPCQAFTLAQRINNNNHPDYISELRYYLKKLCVPYIIENVVGCPLEKPFMLCGQMFEGLKVYRHRIFECNFTVKSPEHKNHKFPIAKMGRPPRVNEFMHVVGHFSGAEKAKQAMGIDWMTRDELAQAIPPAYTEFIGKQLIEHLKQ